MKVSDQIKNLNENMQALAESVRWLQRSYSICNEQFDLKNLTDEGFDAFEALTSRFARVVDILTNKVTRSIVYLEQGTSYTWIDTLFYLKKQGLISSIDEVRLIKEIRNEIVHEYIVSDLKQLFNEVLNNCKMLFTLVENTKVYVNQLINKFQ